MFEICPQCGAIVYFTMLVKHLEDHDRQNEINGLVAEIAGEVTTIEEALGTLDAPGPLIKKWMGS